MTHRRIDNCPYRISGLVSHCTLLKRLAEGLNIETAVGVDACSECVSASPVERGRLNPVVASLLLDRLDLAAQENEPPADKLSRRQLQEFARRHLESLSSDTNRAGQPSRPSPKTQRFGWFSLLSRKKTSIGIVGWDTKTGLGYQNLSLAQHLNADRWLVPVDQRHRPDLSTAVKARVKILPTNVPISDCDDWLQGLQWIVFAETEFFPGLARRARQLGVRVACIPNHEALCIGRCDWLHDVDLMICPTKFTFQRMSRLNHQFGFSWHVIVQPWPVDARRFTFRQRDVCERFLFVNGTGGMRAFHPDGSRTSHRRKGLDVVLAAAKLVPHIPITIISQAAAPDDIPDNIEWYHGVPDNRQLYDKGDVLVHPVSWEGIGLQLLEAQASGLPVLTTDAPPMNEYQPLATIPVERLQTVSVLGHQPLEAAVINPEELAGVMKSLHGSSIRQASTAARNFVTRHHSWSSSATRILEAMAAVDLMNL